MSGVVSDIFFVSWYVVLASGVVFAAMYTSTVSYLKNKDYDRWVERRATYGLGFALIGSVIRGDDDGVVDYVVDHVLQGKRLWLKRSLLVFAIAFTVFVICFPLVFLENLA